MIENLIEKEKRKVVGIIIGNEIFRVKLKMIKLKLLLIILIVKEKIGSQYKQKNEKRYLWSLLSL